MSLQAFKIETELISNLIIYTFVSVIIIVLIAMILFSRKYRKTLINKLCYFGLGLIVTIVIALNAYYSTAKTPVLKETLPLKEFLFDLSGQIFLLAWGIGFILSYFFSRRKKHQVTSN